MVVLDPNVRIIAFDPGGTTGWAMWQAMIIPGIVAESLKMSQSYRCGHITGETQGQEIENLLGTMRVQQFIVVCERYDERQNGKHADPVALEHIGVIKNWCKDNGVELVMQMPGVAKPFVKDINLKRLGVLQPKKWKHAMDAYRHLFWYMINGTPKRTDLLKIGWPNQ